ncbi:MAG: amino acid transporter [Crocinitomix sp.]|jgi:amino acid transporter
MAESKKFGTFGGVFTPSILTILGVIMYLRMGEVVGNSGLWGTILIILLAHLVSITTGLSISSIATDKKVGAGGVYYVLSRSLGLPIGGALGMTLFVATALSISLYMVGFAEIANQQMSFGVSVNELGKNIYDLNSIRITGSIGLLALGIVALISTSIAIKSQFFILGAILLSLVAIFLGDTSLVSTEVMAETYTSPGFFPMFAIFFPAVTGFTAGIAMSGDLKDPKKSIPYGTLLAIGAGLIIYVLLAIYLSTSFSNKELIENNELLYKIAYFGSWAVLAGVFGATLSSALGGILGGPRILQAMSVDKITPKFFAKGVGKGNEPRNALILTLVIAEGGILIGDLNVIAEVVSMFYLTAYGFINLSFFLESWASSDFKPTFKVNKWIGLAGFVVSFIIMSQLNLLAMVAAIVIIGGIYFYLSRKQIALGTGDIWQSVWATIVKKGLKRMETGSDHKRNWKPNTLLFSTDNKQRSKMIEFSKAVSGQGGIITNFDLHENPEAPVLFPKSKETVEDEELEKYGIFGRKLEVQNIFKGIESIACTFGFSGIEPNTVLMNWPGQTKDPVWFKDMTAKLISLDYNVLYLDYDERWGFRKKEKIDLWWRGVGNNAELMLSLAKFITSSPDWSHANIRILLANNTNVNFKVVENRIKAVLEQFRVNAEIKIINNEVDQKPIYDLMKMHSSEADLVFVGIPEILPNEREEFVTRTNNLVGVIGTTLLVKASSQFEETDLKLEQISLTHEPLKVEQIELVEIVPSVDESLQGALADLDTKLDGLVTTLVQKGIQPIENYHHSIFSKVTNRMDDYLLGISEDNTAEEIQESLQKVLNEVKDLYADALENQLPAIFDEFDLEIKNYFGAKEELITYLPKKISVDVLLTEGLNQSDIATRKIQYRDSIRRVWYSKGMKDDFSSLLEFGYQNLILLHQSKNILHDVVWKLLSNIDQNGVNTEVITACKDELDKALRQVDDEALNLAANLYKSFRNNERLELNKLSECLLKKRYNQELQAAYSGLPNKEFQTIRKGTTAFPTYWYRNLILFTYHLEADIYLIAYTAKIQKLAGEISAHIDENYLNKITDNIGGLEVQLDTLLDKIDKGEEKEILGSAVRIEEELFFNSEFVISHLMSSVNDMNSEVPEEIELMTAKSINRIREAQGDQILTEKIALNDITEYIVRSQFVDPLHEHIQTFYAQLKRMTGKLITTTILIQKGIDTYATNGKVNQLKEIIETAKIDIQSAKSDFDAAQKGFDSEVKARQEMLRVELDVNQIIEQVETLRQYAKQQKRRNIILDKFQKVNKSASKKVSSLLDYLAQKQQDLSATEYKERYTELVSEQGLLAEFIETIGPRTELPFFYQQLFTGTHYSDSKTIENRRAEINRISNAIKRIDEGKTGAIAIVGAAGSGKTYLATHVSSHILSGSIYKILPPVNRTWTKEDLTKALQRATGINEPLQKLMNKLPSKSSIIFEDVEQWWLKAENGEVIINELAKLINKFSGKHYFVITSNIHAYSLVCQSTNIQNAIIESVVLAPLNANQIKDAIWSRHQTGGLHIRLDNEKEQHISVNKLNKYLSRYHGVSKGNIGLALQQWINAIIEKDDNYLVIKSPTLHEVPFIGNVEWTNLIFQLFIHYNLSREELYRIYGENNKNWINRLLQSMKNAGLIEQNERGEFLLNKLTKPYIENWLNEVGFIK